MIKKLFIFTFLFIGSVFVTIQPTYATPLTSEFETEKIIFLGDSITNGYGATALDRKWVSIVSNELGFDSYVNYGVGGATVSQYVDGNPNLIDIADTMDLDADIVVVMGGVNDGYNSVPIGTTADVDPTLSFYGGLNTLIPLLKTNYPTARIIFMTPYSASSLNTTSYANAIIDRARHYEIEFLDIRQYIGFDLTDPVDQSIYAIDTVHLSNQGNRRLADILISYLYPDYTGNLYPSTNNNENYSLGINGELVVNAGFSVSDYIEINENSTYYYSAYDYNANARSLSWYNKDYVHISNSTNVTPFVTAPIGAKYVRHMNYLTSLENRVFSKVVNYDYTVDFNLRGGKSINNLFDENYIKLNYYINSSGASIYSEGGFYQSEYIKIDPNTRYVYNPHNLDGTFISVAFYQSNFNFISTLYNTSNNFTTPSNAKYLILSVYSQPTNEVTLYKQGGDTPVTQYVTEYRGPVQPTDPIKSSFTFTGWYSDFNYTNEFDFSTVTITSDTTVYANYEFESETVSGILRVFPIIFVLIIVVGNIAFIKFSKATTVAKLITVGLSIIVSLGILRFFIDFIQIFI